MSSNPLDNLVYINVETMNVDYDNNAITLKGSWTDIPAGFPNPPLDSVPVYFNFQPNTFAVHDATIELIRADIGGKVQNYFENYTYRISEDSLDSSLILNAYLIP